MKRALTIIIFSPLFALVDISQNLVPNFGFEVYDTCPSVQDQAEYSTGWFKVSETITTPDYFNACSPSNVFGVPQSGVLYQPDLRNCGAYMGLITYSLPNFPEYREQVSIQLSQPLVIGQKIIYHFKPLWEGIK